MPPKRSHTDEDQGNTRKKKKTGDEAPDANQPTFKFDGRLMHRLLTSYDAHEPYKQERGHKGEKWEKVLEEVNAEHDQEVKLSQKTAEKRVKALLDDREKPNKREMVKLSQHERTAIASVVDRIYSKKTRFEEERAAARAGQRNAADERLLQLAGDGQQVRAAAQRVLQPAPQPAPQPSDSNSDARTSGPSSDTIDNVNADSSQRCNHGGPPIESSDTIDNVNPTSAPQTTQPTGPQHEAMARFISASRQAVDGKFQQEMQVLQASNALAQRQIDIMEKGNVLLEKIAAKLDDSDKENIN